MIHRLSKAYEGVGPNVKNGLIFPYHCSKDPKRSDGTLPWTIGYGHLLSLKEEKLGVKVGGTLVDVMRNGLTQSQADLLYAQDVSPRMDTVLKYFTKPIPGLTQVQFDWVMEALLDCLFNCGEQCLYSSPGVLARAGKIKEASIRLLLYRCADNIPIRGLWRRRVSGSIYMNTGEVLIINDKVPSRTVMSPLEIKATAKLSSLVGTKITLPPGLH